MTSRGGNKSNLLPKLLVILGGIWNNFTQMKTTYVIMLLMAGLITGGCKDEKKAEDDSSQMKEVLAIHDEIMPAMHTIGKLVGELKPKVDSTEAGQNYEAAMKDLQAAHKSMMDWMQNFGNRFDSGEILEGKPLTEEKQHWLDEEEEKVKALREQINSSIAKAEAILKE